MYKFFMLAALTIVTGSMAYASDYSTVLMECSIRMPADNRLPAIPQFKFEVAQNEDEGGYVLVETPLRPVGATAIYKPLNQAGSAYSSTFKTDEGIAVTFSDADYGMQKAVLEAGGLTYDCVQPCASRHYNPKTNNCEFPNSLAPLPKGN